ncbi:type IV pilin [Candidatus Woesearchaeota archaeon]|nr:type IV pilin [Candidatus Woesearchaeota archaeon]
MVKTGDITMMNKKALSPLIAAVLLIVVVVGIGAVVTGIVRNQIQENKQTITKTSTDVDCSTNIQMNVPTYADDFMICLGSDYVNFTLENTGTDPIDNLQLKVFGDSGFADNDSGVLSTPLAVGQTLSNFVVYYDTADVGPVQEVYIVPKKKVTGQTNQIFCNEAKLRFVDISNC